VIRDARNLIANKVDWFGGKDAGPAAILEDGSFVLRRCALLAIMDAARALDADMGDEVLKTWFQGMDSTALVNFNNSHTHQEVLTIFDQVLET
jgi:hypothetical protein